MQVKAQDFIGFAPAAARNQEPILSVLDSIFRGDETILEIGSGSGQHAVFLSHQLPSLSWIPSEIEEQLPILKANLDHFEMANICQPVLLNLEHENWHEKLSAVDAVFSANTLHIISWAEVVSLFNQINQVLKSQGLLILYGPFRYNSDYTSQGNADFDRWLKDRDPHSGIRDFEKVDALAQNAGLRLSADIRMPANNQLLVWQKR